MSRTARTAALCAALLLLCAPAPGARADTVHLNNGESVEGRVVRDDAEAVILAVEGGRLRLARSTVERIEWSDPAGRARTLARAGRWARALRLLEGLDGPGLDAARRSLLLSWAQALCSGGRLERARHVLGLFPEPASPQARDLARRLEEDEEALARAMKAAGRRGEPGVFFQALRAWPSRRRAILGRLGSCFFSLAQKCAREGRHGQALDRLRKALALDPRLAPAVLPAVEPLLLRAAAGRADPSTLDAWAAFYPHRTAARAALALGLGLHGRREEAEAEARRLGLPLDTLGRPCHEKSGSSAPRVPGPAVLPPGPEAPRAEAAGPLSEALSSCAAGHLDRLARLWSLDRPLWPGSLRIEAAEPGALPAWAGGSCHAERTEQGPWRGTVVLRVDSPQLLSGVLPHELGHLAFTVWSDGADGLPLWVHEGAALWSEPQLRRWHVETLLSLFLAEERLLPWERMWAVTHEKGLPDAPSDLDRFYAQSYGLFLRAVETRGLAAVQRYVALRASGSSDSAARVEALDMDGSEPWQAAWLSWAKKRFPPPWSESWLETRPKTPEKPPRIGR